jgi:arylsulfatase A-like enzyme
VQRQLPIPTGVIQSQVASVCDLFPTLAGLLSVDLPNDHAVDGDDLTTLLTGKKDSSRVEAFLMHYPHGPHRSDYFTVYREGDWKVIYHFFPTEVSGGSHYQLFNLKKDPFELTDVAGKQPKVLKRLMRGLAESLESHEALYPVNKKDQPVLPIVP